MPIDFGRDPDTTARTQDYNPDERRYSPTHSATLYVIAVVLLSGLGVAAILALTVLRPASDNTATIMVVLGFLVPTVTALMAGAVGQVNKAVDGRLTQLLAMTARTHAAEGEIVGQAKAAVATALLVTPLMDHRLNFKKPPPPPPPPDCPDPQPPSENTAAPPKP